MWKIFCMYAISQTDWFVLLWFWVCWLDVLNPWLVVMFWAWAFTDFCEIFFLWKFYLLPTDIWRKYFVSLSTASCGCRCKLIRSYSMWRRSAVCKQSGFKHLPVLCGRSFALSSCQMLSWRATAPRTSWYTFLKVLNFRNRRGCLQNFHKTHQVKGCLEFFIPKLPLGALL